MNDPYEDTASLKKLEELFNRQLYEQLMQRLETPIIHIRGDREEIRRKLIRQLADIQLGSDWDSQCKDSLTDWVLRHRFSLLEILKMQSPDDIDSHEPKQST